MVVQQFLTVIHIWFLFLGRAGRKDVQKVSESCHCWRAKRMGQSRIVAEACGSFSRILSAKSGGRFSMIFWFGTSFRKVFWVWNGLNNQVIWMRTCSWMWPWVVWWPEIWALAAYWFLALPTMSMSVIQNQRESTPWVALMIFSIFFPSFPCCWVYLPWDGIEWAILGGWNQWWTGGFVAWFSGIPMNLMNPNLSHAADSRFLISGWSATAI